ncbi:hypothetical protein DCC85_01635 [Paenibacillus sp. CAA11]|uniref:hypothetical protein n=1 Tax=Paenibacillus sp. CAA11 TaxID=1532905 RepID=UPI000D3A7501|nr:hypothetical protein [Paenibacillus sp. CAA11]AWB43058.1 hypothetical protein DCC85_01635 [Paenibacillus sp. CAA11]
MKFTKMMAGLLTFLLVSMAVLPAGASAAATKSLKEVCTITVDKTDLIVSDDYSKGSGYIQLQCDLKQVLYTDISSKAGNPAVVSTMDGIGGVTVKALRPGTSSVTVSANGYDPVQFNFTVADTGTSTGTPADNGSSTDPSSSTEYDPAYLLLLQQTQNYMAQLEKIIPYETKALDTYNKYRYVTSKTRKEAYYAFNGTIIPNYTKFLGSLKTVKTSNSFLAQNHNNYIKGVSLQLQGLTLMKKALYSSKINTNLYKQANAKIDAGRKLLDQYFKGIDKHMAQFE